MSETIVPKQLISEAKSAYQRGDYSAAASAYEAAAKSYEGAGDELIAAEMHNNSCVSFIQAGDAQAAIQAVVGTVPIFAAAGDIRRQGMAMGNLGAALEADDQLEEAADAYNQSAELLKQGGENDFRVSVMQSLSAIQLRTGHQLEALATMQAGLEGIERPKPQQRFLKKLLQLPYKYLGKS